MHRTGNWISGNVCFSNWLHWSISRELTLFPIEFMQISGRFGLNWPRWCHRRFQLAQKCALKHKTDKWRWKKTIFGEINNDWTQKRSKINKISTHSERACVFTDWTQQNRSQSAIELVKINKRSDSPILALFEFTNGQWTIVQLVRTITARWIFKSEFFVEKNIGKNMNRCVIMVIFGMWLRARREESGRNTRWAVGICIPSTTLTIYLERDAVWHLDSNKFTTYEFFAEKVKNAAFSPINRPD